MTSFLCARSERGECGSCCMREGLSDCESWWEPAVRRDWDMVKDRALEEGMERWKIEVGDRWGGGGTEELAWFLWTSPDQHEASSGASLPGSDSASLCEGMQPEALPRCRFLRLHRLPLPLSPSSYLLRLSISLHPRLQTPVCNFYHALFRLATLPLFSLATIPQGCSLIITIKSNR